MTGQNSFPLPYVISLLFFEPLNDPVNLECFVDLPFPFQVHVHWFGYRIHQHLRCWHLPTVWIVATMQSDARAEEMCQQFNQQNWHRSLQWSGMAHANRYDSESHRLLLVPVPILLRSRIRWARHRVSINLISFVSTVSARLISSKALLLCIILIKTLESGLIAKNNEISGKPK